MRTAGVHHVSLVVRDIARAREFYGDLIGLPEIARPDFGIPGAWFQAGPVQLHLLEPPSDADAGQPPSEFTVFAAPVAFEIDDASAVAADLAAAGYDVRGVGSPSGQLFVRDPDGNLVEFIAPGGRLGRAPPDAEA